MTGRPRTGLKMIYTNDYSADGWMQYDIDNDGESWKPIQYLTGSPLIR